jgi:hypothetical protein
MLDNVESMAWRMLAALGHGRLCLLGLAFAATLTFAVATNDRLVIFSALNLYGSIGLPVHDSCVHKGQKSVYAVKPTSCQTVLDCKVDPPLIPTPRQRSIIRAPASPRLSLHGCFRTAFHSSRPVQNGALQGDLYLKGYEDPALVREAA